MRHEPQVRPQSRRRSGTGMEARPSRAQPQPAPQPVEAPASRLPARHEHHPAASTQKDNDVNVPFLNNAWGDVGRALFDVPDTELPELEQKLHGLAASEPGRAAEVFTAFAGMVRQERTMRDAEMLSRHPSRSAS